MLMLLVVLGAAMMCGESEAGTAEQPAKALAAPRPDGIGIIGKDGAPMVQVMAGEFTMGDRVFGPVHKVYLDAFYIRNPRIARRGVLEGDQAGEALLLAIRGHAGGRGSAGHRCGLVRRGCLLPMGRQAAADRGGVEEGCPVTDGRTYPWGNSRLDKTRASYNRDGKRRWEGHRTLSIVGSYEAGKSPYGIYDLAGNVWEWVADWYDRDAYKNSPTRNPQGPPTGEFKVFHGGSALSHPADISMALRNRGSPTGRAVTLGFRCAQSVPRSASLPAPGR